MPSHPPTPTPPPNHKTPQQALRAAVQEVALTEVLFRPTRNNAQPVFVTRVFDKLQIKADKRAEYAATPWVRKAIKDALRRFNNSVRRCLLDGITPSPQS